MPNAHPIVRFTKRRVIASALSVGVAGALIAAQGATAPANGYQPGDPPPSADAEYSHGPAYGAAVANNGLADCELGQRGYLLVQNTLDPKKRLLVSDAHTPGNQGTTWAGLARVPAGETFSRAPSIGPQLPNIPGNN